MIAIINRSYYKTAQRIFLHSLFWVCLTLMYVITYSRLDKDNAWVLILKDLLAVVTIFYSTAYIVIPKLFMKGKYILCFFWIILMYVWWGILTYISILYIKEFLEPTARLGMYIQAALKNGLLGLFKLDILPFYLLDYMYLVSLPLGLKIMQALVNIRNEKIKLELKNTELALKNAELAINNLQLELGFLKHQINPHFLFNTLNNIYILVSDNDPNGAASIVKLSGIMNYLLHESNQSILSLTDEVAFLESYINLERLRFSDKLQVRFHYTSDSQDYLVVPLIIFPFIENAFKHGPKVSRKNVWIKIDIEVKQGKLLMDVSNAISNIVKPLDYIGGIGLVNVRKRLELYYGDAYTLEIIEQADRYNVQLCMDLKHINDNMKSSKFKSCNNELIN